ncbi:MAG: hypothetical protein JNK04_02540, partial [Myxococcales bacterium]|nr:hypothetical protein [Myxococcales bacterium]
MSIHDGLARCGEQEAIMTINNQSGRIIWHELLTNDVESAKGFYGELFGWKNRSV